MFCVEDGGIIKITKGDSAKIDVELEDVVGNPYYIESGDTLTLTVRAVATAASNILLQSVSNSACITLNAVDTANLPVGKLSYDIQLNKASGERYTIIGASSTNTSLKNFWVLPEVTI